MKHWILIFACFVLTACATGGPAVTGSDDLPLRRIVLYRNGVGYFERSGTFEGSELKFGVRREDVGDFLSSLTAIERTQGGVQSVSFEAPEQEERAPNPPGDPMPLSRPFVSPTPVSPAQPAGRTSRTDVRLRLAKDGDHDLVVAYVVASPIWRPAYRIVVDEHEALLQSWAVIQNTSGEDWKNVRLSLTTGAPIAFQSDLGTPIIPKRPLVTDTGEVVMAVPGSETAIAQGGGAAPPQAPAPEISAEESDRDVAAEMSMTAPAARPQASKRTSRGAGVARDDFASRGITAQQAQQSVQSIAAVAVLGEGVTRYDIEKPVTVPDDGSTMVAILSRRIPGEAVHLYAPDGGVELSSVHPFRVVRLVNKTGAMLERGTVSVLGSGAFLGQGVLEPLPRDASAFIPFAVDRSIVVESSQTWDEAEGKLVRVTRNMVTVERFSQRSMKYTVRNGGADSVKVYLKHFRLQNAEIVSPPADTELTPSNALVPVRIGAKGHQEYTVIERTPVERTVEFTDDFAAKAVALYLQGPAIDAAQSEALRRALEIREQWWNAQNVMGAKQTELATLRQSAEETRENLKSLRRVTSAGDLRTRLVQRLAELDGRIATLTRELVEAQTNASELAVRLSEALRDVSLVVTRTSR